MLIDAAFNIKNYWRHPTNLIALEFGVVSFSFTAIHNIFMLYFVDMFLFKYGLDFFWLWFSQICFVMWNFASPYFLGNPKQSSTYEMTVTYGGPVLAVVFLLPFVFQFSIESKLFVGVYFTLFLCLYDTLFNRVLLSRSIWLQENVVNLKDKLKIHFLGFIFASVASCSVFPSYLYYSHWNHFGWFCLIISMLSFFGFIFSSFCHMLREGDKSGVGPQVPKPSSSFHKPAADTPFSPLQPSHPTSPSSSYTNKQQTPQSTATNKYNYNTPRADASSAVSLGTLLRNVYAHRNMAIYVVVNVLQVFSSTYSVVFLQLFISRLVDATDRWRAVILFICFFSPVLMNIILSVIASKRDTYELLRFLFQIKIGVSVFALVFGGHLFVAAVFTIFSRAIVESVFGLLMFVNQDVDSEHHVKFGYRKASQRLVPLGKLGQAAAPIVGVLAFALPTGGEGVRVVAVVESNNGLFYSTILVMLLSGSLQLYVWSKYTLYGPYLKDVNVMAKGKFYTDNEVVARGAGAGGGMGNDEGSIRSSFGDTLFNNPNPTSPNLSSIATISHKQVIAVV